MTKANFADLKDCVRNSDLKNIAEQVDLECLKISNPVWDTSNEYARSSRSINAGGFPFLSNPDQIPKSLLEIHADMSELLDNGRELRMARKDDQLCTDKG